MHIVLETTELMTAGYVATARNVQAIMRKWKAGEGRDIGKVADNNFEGACGEVAVAKALGIYYEPIVGEPDKPDVGPYEVRTNSSRRHDDLCLRPILDDKRKDRVFINVLAFTPHFEIIGWIWGHEGMQQKWLRDGTPSMPKCFYVPRVALHPMNELPAVAELLAA